MSSDQCENSSSISAATGRISELEQMFKQLTFTRSITQHPSTMENLPDEILLNIFIRLLAKQLAQMRSVSKTWNALLSQPSFIKSHLHRSIHNNNKQIHLVFQNCHMPFTQYSSQSPHLEPINFIKHTPSKLPTRVIDSVNGLICLSTYYYSDILIWNPSLSALSTIPPPHSMPPRSHYESSIRFGFDPKTNDYKLVKLTGLRDIPDAFANVKEWLQVEVYSMRKGSWDLITHPFPPHITRIYNTDYLCVDGHGGHLHWENMTGRTIVAFDLGSETFHEMPLPDSILDSNYRYRHIGVLGGKLYEMSYRDDGVWEVWVMEEYGVHESWVKRLVFSQFKDAWGYSFGFTLRNELLVLDVLGSNSRLGLYDSIENKTKFTRTNQRVFRIVEYVDSLVWI